VKVLTFLVVVDNIITLSNAGRLIMIT